jgi:hypothetical protein
MSVAEIDAHRSILASNSPPKRFLRDWYHWEVQYSSSPSKTPTLFYFCHFDLGFGAVFIFPTAGFMIESFS